MVDRRYYSELKSLGEKIRELRKKKELTQLDIEVRTGINRANISKIESGRLNVEFYTLIRLAEVFEIDTYELLKYK